MINRFASIRGFPPAAARANRRVRVCARSLRRGLSLIELLLVVGIIAILVAILAPALSGARQNARSVACRANLRGLIEGMLVYSGGAEDAIIPSYNMTGVSFSARNPLDGWGPILDKGNFVIGSREISGNPFCCPNTLSIPGMSGTQTGSDPMKPRGYMDWPAVISLSQVYAMPAPQWGMEKVIRVGYWINGDNPIGRPLQFIPGVHFTGSVGYGPDPDGKVMQAGKISRIRWPSRLIALSDGIYSGNQEVTRLGDRNLRIGYRHAGRNGRANVAFADGHVDSIEGDAFPRKFGEGGIPLETVRAENLGEGPTLYTDPQRDLALPLSGG